MRMKTFEILQELLKCDKDMKWTNAVGKMEPVGLLHVMLAQTFNL